MVVRKRRAIKKQKIEKHKHRELHIWHLLGLADLLNQQFKYNLIKLYTTELNRLKVFLSGWEWGNPEKG